MGDSKPTSSLLMGIQYTIRKHGQIPFNSHQKFSLKVRLIHRIEIERLPMVQTQPNIPSRQNTVWTITRSTGRRDSLLHGRKMRGLIFKLWKIRPQGGTVLLWSRHLLLFLFLSGENQVRTKNPNDSSMEKKRSVKTRFLGPGIRLPIGKVPHMR